MKHRDIFCSGMERKRTLIHQVIKRHYANPGKKTPLWMTPAVALPPFPPSSRHICFTGCAKKKKTKKLGIICSLTGRRSRSHSKTPSWAAQRSWGWLVEGALGQEYLALPEATLTWARGGREGRGEVMKGEGVKWGSCTLPNLERALESLGVARVVWW